MGSFGSVQVCLGTTQCSDYPVPTAAVAELAINLIADVHFYFVRTTRHFKKIMLCKQQTSILHSSSHRQPLPCHRYHCAAVSSRRPHPQQQRLPPAASSYTQPALEAIRAAQQQACRQGSIFVAPPHLLLGLLDVPYCTASQLLQAAGLSAAAADAALVDAELLPKSSFMAAGDLHWAPDARVALTAAAEAAQAAGGYALCAAMQRE
jgi:hypothetical protein